MSVELRDYQIDIANRAAGILLAHGIVYLAMEVRTGKTLTALQTASNVNASQVLFVTKKKAISSIDKDCCDMAPAFGMVIVNFEQLHKIQPGFDLVIIDEAHSIGAFPKPSQRAEELKRICSNDCRVIYLSGTPTPESYSQFYHQFYITKQSPWNYLPNFYKWAKEYVTVQKLFVYGRELNDYSNADEVKVKADINELVIHYSQQDAGFEQVVEDEVLLVPCPGNVAAAVELLKRDRVFTTKAGHEILGDTAVKLMSKCHQIFSGSVIAEDGQQVAFNDFKARFIKQHFAGKKIAIFYKFQAEATHLVNVFGKDAIAETPEEFNQSSHLVYISQIQSGREGINLSTADALVMYNIDYSALSYWQARARLQSKDRADAAKVYWIMTNGGIEEKIYEAVQGKKDYTLKYFKKDFAV
jgi:hypothetical protein